MEKSWWEGFMVSPTNDVYHFCPHTISPNSVTQPHPNARYNQSATVTSHVCIIQFLRGLSYTSLYNMASWKAIKAQWLNV